MADQIDHRSAVVRMLSHAGIDRDTAESVMFHFDQAGLQARSNGREDALRGVIAQLEAESSVDLEATRS